MAGWLEEALDALDAEVGWMDGFSDEELGLVEMDEVA